MKHLTFISVTLISLLLVSCTSNYQSKGTGDVDWAFPGFEKVDSLNPILTPSKDLAFIDPITNTEVNWEERNVLNPTALVKGDSVYLLYRAQDSLGTSRIGMAVSSDGLNFVKRPSPIFYPDKDEMKKYEWNYRKIENQSLTLEDCYFCYFDGVEDPRIFESEEGQYFMTYTAYDGKTARLSIASSTNLSDWRKHGPILKDSIYLDHWSKAGAIISELKNQRWVAKKIDGKYWMYFGDTNIFMAYSQDLINWEPAINKESGKLISVMHPRMGRFDSRLVEPGPVAMYKDEGIHLIYNGSNASNYNESKLPKFTYAAGQALFDKETPYKLIDRKENHFIAPDKDYERVGEVNEVCFVEGLVHFKEKWFLYYGTADSKIAVAISE